MSVITAVRSLRTQLDELELRHREMGEQLIALAELLEVDLTHLSDDCYARCLMCNEPYGKPFSGELVPIRAACGCEGVGLDCTNGGRRTYWDNRSYGCDRPPELNICFRCRQRPERH